MIVITLPCVQDRFLCKRKQREERNCPHHGTGYNQRDYRTVQSHKSQDEIAGNGWQEVRFAQPAAGRYFCLEGTSNYEGNNIAAIAELDVLDNNGKPVSRENWKIVYADSEETRSGNRTADKVFDLQESTFWQTVDNTAYPHQIVIDLGKEYNVTGFRMLPRAEAGAPGLIKDYKVYVKKSDFTY